MKRILTAAVLAALAMPALAADIPTRKSAPAPIAPAYVPPAFSWTGFYVGVNGGYDYGSFRSGGNARFGHPSGGALGVQAGYNAQIGQYVIGLENNVDWTNARSTHGFAGNNYSARVSATDTFFGRAGVSLDRALIFGEAGYAGAEVKGANNTLGLSNKSWRSGVGVGGGIEYAFTNNISARADYVYSYLGKKTYFGGTPAAVNTGLDLSQVRGGLNYKF